MDEKVYIRKAFVQGKSTVVALPPKVREELGIETGDELKVEIEDEAIKIRKYFE